MYNVYDDPQHQEVRDSLKQILKELQIKFDDEGLEFEEMKLVQQEYFWTSN